MIKLNVKITIAREAVLSAIRSRTLPRPHAALPFLFSLFTSKMRLKNSIIYAILKIKLNIFFIINIKIIK